MAEIIKISLVWSGEESSYECDRVLPVSYFNQVKFDLFSNEIESMRQELAKQVEDPAGFKEYVRIAAINTETGEMTPTWSGGKK